MENACGGEPKDIGAPRDMMLSFKVTLVTGSTMAGAGDDEQDVADKAGAIKEKRARSITTISARVGRSNVENAGASSKKQWERPRKGFLDWNQFTSQALPSPETADKLLCCYAVCMHRGLSWYVLNETRGKKDERGYLQH